MVERFGDNKDDRFDDEADRAADEWMVDDEDLESPPEDREQTPSYSDRPFDVLPDDGVDSTQAYNEGDDRELV